MKSDVAVTTVSWIRTNEESRIVLQTIYYLSQLNIPLFIVDSGSPKQDIQKIKKQPNVIFFENKERLTKQLIQGFLQALKLKL